LLNDAADAFSSDLDKGQMTEQISRSSTKVKIWLRDAARAACLEILKQRRWLKHLRLLALRRYGPNWRLPNDVHGRNMLLAMLAAGLTGPDAQRWAPWVGWRQLQDMIRNADSREWDGDALGTLVELTNDEREPDKLWSLRPCDRDWSSVQEQRRERKRERDRKRITGKRRDRGVTPRAEWLAANSLSRTKPWEAKGISRRTFERRKRRAVGASCTSHGDAGVSPDTLTFPPSDTPASRRSGRSRKVSADQRSSPMRERAQRTPSLRRQRQPYAEAA
jgi:hypothetical protein